MPNIKLREGQEKALKKMKNGCILNGDTGSGKSITALAYYYTQNGGKLEINSKNCKMKRPKDLYIITTAHKRDTLEWEEEMLHFLISTNKEVSIYDHNVVVDSWNNIEKYENVKDAFFIFDEQRVVGYGKWSKTFIKIAKKNNWILLSATPGDTWSDYIPVFIANGFYKNKAEFEREHVVWSHRVSFPKVDRYLNTRRLVRLRDLILVDMEVDRHTIQHHENISVEYDKITYKEMMKKRWNIWEDRPMRNAAELCYSLRKLVNADISRIIEVMRLISEKDKAIIFYNFDYERDILLNINYGEDVEIAEWTGHKHQPVPTSNKWVYLVQYTAGCEGWNCITTNTIIFYSQNYSYKVMKQACGRIDRLNTPFTNLYYYHLRSSAPIDMAIRKAVDGKKKFNERKFVKWDDDYIMRVA